MQPAASVERIKRRPPETRAVRAHVTTRRRGSRTADGILGRMAPSYDCDVLVAGGGPAGSAAAAFLGRAGRRVVLVERDRFPRFHIGESLLASVNDVLRAIGADALVRGAGFTQKWGATFLPADGSFERHLGFGSAPGVGMPQTWQVPRARFDELLLRHAAACGADVREQQRIVAVDFDA